MAVAHKILVIAYSISQDRDTVSGLGGTYFDKLHPERVAKRLVLRLRLLGLDVIVTPSEPLNARFNKR